MGAGAGLLLFFLGLYAFVLRLYENNIAEGMLVFVSCSVVGALVWLLGKAVCYVLTGVGHARLSRE
jgi:hypothetical protein